MTVIDPHHPHPALDQIRGRILLDIDKVFRERIARPQPIRIRRLEQDPFPHFDPMLHEFIARDYRAVPNPNDTRRAHRGIERKFVDRRRVGHKVQRRIHMCAGMHRKRYL